MSPRKEVPQLMNKWVWMMSALLLSQILFKCVDGTIFDPKLNPLGEAFMKNIERTLDWFTWYHSPFLKFITCVYVMYLLIICLIDFVFPLFRRRKK